MSLKRLVKICLQLTAIAIIYVMLDYMVDLNPPQVQDSYRFELDDLRPDKPRILRQDNLSILVVKRSADTIALLRRAAQELQDPGSHRSQQPGFAKNALRSSQPELFVSYAFGTDLGCSLETGELEIKEICGTARYDFAGRAFRGEKGFQNLPIPDYNFSNDFKTLTIRP